MSWRDAHTCSSSEHVFVHGCVGRKATLSRSPGVVDSHYVWNYSRLGYCTLIIHSIPPRDGQELALCGPIPTATVNDKTLHTYTHGIMVTRRPVFGPFGEGP